MKSIIKVIFPVALILICTYATAQVIDPAKETKKESTKRVNKEIDQGIDKGLDKVEGGIGKLFGKKKKQKKQEDESINNQEEKPVIKQEESNQTESRLKNQEDAQPVLKWSKYDFVPGDKIIFEDNQDDEENGEFPSRWDLVKGTVENAEFGGENIIMFRGGNPMIVPYLKDPEKDYLPEVFTIEFDLYTNNHNDFQVYFWDAKNQNVTSIYQSLNISYNGMYLSPAGSKIPGNKTIDNHWAHIAIAYTRGKLKAYIDETRLINIPHLAFDPIGITLYAYHGSDKNIFYIKNFRLAEGGVKFYDRMMQEGKIVANGIRFEVGKATLRPESMGVINEIYDLMKDNPEIKFSVEGHTDNDGDESMNQTLSEERAQTVVQTLIDKGISPDRLTSVGWGESKPIDSNSTPEGKANNRRVEFVKI